MSTNDTLSSYLKWDYVPELNDPCMIVGFHGWSDAGNVSSDTLRYLIETLEPRKFASLTYEPFINYTIDRPVGQISEGLIHHVEPMVTDLVWWSNPESNRDVILVLGKEPHFNWVLFGDIFLSVIRRLRVTQVYTVGGVQDAISHSASPRISIVASSKSAANKAEGLDEAIQLSDYYGPISIHSCLVNLCGQTGIDGVSFWGHAPAYLQKNPRLVAKIITILNKAVDMQVHIDSLTKRAMEMDRRIKEILAKDPNLKQFVEGIEEKKGLERQAPTGEKIIRLEEFLRKDSHKDPKP